MSGKKIIDGLALAAAHASGYRAGVEAMRREAAEVADRYMDQHRHVGAALTSSSIRDGILALPLPEAPEPAVDVAEVLAALEPLAARYREVSEQDGPTASARCMVDTAHLAKAATLAVKLWEKQ